MLNTINPRAFCEIIYCGYTRWNAFTLDEPSGRIEFDAVVTDRGGEKTYKVAFDGVRLLPDDSLHLREAQGPDDRLELSVIEIEREAAGWRLWFNPWYLHEIQFHCDRVHLDGVEVVGGGRWLQDDLPSRTAG